MNWSFINSQCGFFNRLCVGWMSMASSRNILRTCAKLHGQSHLSNHISAVRTYNMNSNTLSVFASARIFTKPSVSLLTFALELAKKGNLPTLYATLSPFNCSSISLCQQLPLQVMYRLLRV